MTLILTCKRNAGRECNNCNEALHQQMLIKHAKLQATRNKKIQTPHAQQYNSKRCAKTGEDEFDVFNELATKTAHYKLSKNKYH